MPESNREEKRPDLIQNSPDQPPDKEIDRQGLSKVPFSRDIRILTEVLILLELINNPRLKLKEIADRLGISKQAVSDYLKISMDEKKLEKDGGTYKVTYKGVALLQSSLLETQDFVKEALEKLPVFSQVTALARTKIKKNEIVGLFMEKGVLTARAGTPSSSTGVSLHAAEKDEEVKIGSLEGVVDHEIASLTLVLLPDRSRHCNLDKLALLLEQRTGNKLAMLDLVSRVITEKLGLQADMEFSAGESSLEAVLKGVPVIVLGTGKAIEEMKENIARHEASLQKKIPVELIDLTEG